MSDGQSEACESIAQQNAAVSVRLERGEAVKWHDGEQQRKIMDYVDSQQIDWSKPVEWHFLPGNVLCPVVFTKEVNGKRWAVIQRLDVLEAVPAHGRWLKDYRNVRRKVKQTLWVAWTRCGVVSTWYDKMDAMKIINEHGGSYHELTREADADE